LPIEAPPAAVWALLCDAPRFAGLFPYISVDALESPEPGRWLFWRRLAVPTLASLAWREENRVTGECTLAFRAVEGDLHTFAGRWLVTAEGGDAVLHLALEYEIPAAVAAQAPAGLAGYVMNELFKSLCRRVKETVEGEAQ